MGRSWSSVVSFRFCIEVGKIPQVLFNLLLIHYSQLTGMCLIIPHSCISDRVNTPAILFHFLYVLPKLLPRFSLEHSRRIHLDLLHFLTSLSLASVGSPSGKKASYQSNNQLHQKPSWIKSGPRDKCCKCHVLVLCLILVQTHDTWYRCISTGCVSFNRQL